MAKKPNQNKYGDDDLTRTPQHQRDQLSNETDLGGGRVGMDAKFDPDAPLRSDPENVVDLDEEDLDDLNNDEEETEAIDADATHPADRRGWSGDAGGIFPNGQTTSDDMDYSGAGSGMDDETAGTTSRSGRGGGAGYSTSRITMGDEDGLTSYEATRADRGGMDDETTDADVVDVAEDRDVVDTAMSQGSGYSVDRGQNSAIDALDNADIVGGQGDMSRGYAAAGRSGGMGSGSALTNGDLRDDAIGYSGSTTGIGDTGSDLRTNALSDNGGGTAQSPVEDASPPSKGRTKTKSARKTGGTSKRSSKKE